MDNFTVWKHGINVVYGRFDWIQLRKSLFNFHELDYIDGELEYKLRNYQGLFEKKHHFLYFKDMNEKKNKLFNKLDA
jgi:hypothetical protein